ncbi:golgin subfamily A member 6-like protein 22 [Anthonomus grandis grandis]|uniref:golgin subfamily A member 6-like protein 22 n=1 Tax=Anthonomus grandis grandis TaxID=2921223 RepID=UPI002166A384|nr:golgin subfamily A member 6-like protein 22 [Anthonomus grandis grandis]
MPPKPKQTKQKAKDGGVTADQAEHAQNVVKDYWPYYPITRENIMQPTKEFVMNLYEECVKDIEKKLSFLNRNYVAPRYPPNFDPEQILFDKLSRNIPLLQNSGFRLGDLYVFDPKRLRWQILLMMHFLMTTENRMDQVAVLSGEVFDCHEMLQTSKEKIKEQKELKSERMSQVTLAKKEHETLQEAAVPINANYEKTLKAIEETDKKCTGLVLEVERLKSQIDNFQEEIEKYEKTESELKTQVVTQEEYDHLKTIQDCLVKDLEKLEENCSMNGLLELKTNFEYLGKCSQELQHLDLPEELLKLSSSRDQLKREQNDLTYALTTNNTSKAEIKKLELELEQQKQKLTQDIKSLQNELQILTDDAMLKEKELKMSYQEEEGNLNNQIDQLQEGLRKLGADFVKLKQGIINNVKMYLDMKDALLNTLKD